MAADNRSIIIFEKASGAERDNNSVKVTPR